MWSAPYDGEDPPPEEYQPSTLEETGRTRPQTTSRATQPPNQVHQSGPPARDLNAAPGLLELEWDDSYDACPTQPHSEEGQDAQAIPDEPPQHIQELRRTAIMLVKGSYIEESEFQNDVMVYDLVAQKDVQDPSNSYHASSKPAESEQLESGEPASDHNPIESSMSNGTSIEDCNKKAEQPAQSVRSEIPEGEDLMAQYEDLIRSLAAQSSSPTNSELKSPTELMEEEVEFNSFLPETPELEMLPSSPFGTKPRSGSKGHAVPFTGQKTLLLFSFCYYSEDFYVVLKFFV